MDISATVPELPPAPEGGEYGFSGFENVYVDVTGWCGDTVETDLLALSEGEVEMPCNPLTAGAAGNSEVEGTEGNYDITFDINPDAIEGDHAGVGDFDIVFSGMQSSESDAGDSDS